LGEKKYTLDARGRIPSWQKGTGVGGSVTGDIKINSPLLGHPNRDGIRTAKPIATGRRCTGSAVWVGCKPAKTTVPGKT